MEIKKIKYLKYRCSLLLSYFYC